MRVDKRKERGDEDPDPSWGPVASWGAGGASSQTLSGTFAGGLGCLTKWKAAPGGGAFHVYSIQSSIAKAAPPKQRCQSSAAKAAPAKQYQSSTKAAPKQHQSSAEAAPKQHQSSTALHRGCTAVLLYIAFFNMPTVLA